METTAGPEMSGFVSAPSRADPAVSTEHHLGGDHSLDLATLTMTITAIRFFSVTERLQSIIADAQSTLTGRILESTGDASNSQEGA